jgi:hypothetical protein
MPDRKEGAMPSGTVTISPEQRNGIYELARNHLAGLNDVYLAMEVHRDFATAERLGREFAEDLRLLGDIGWRPEDYRQKFVITMGADDLVGLLTRLKGEAEQLLLGAERQAAEQEAETSGRFQRGYQACAELLAGLDPGEGEA